MIVASLLALAIATDAPVPAPPITMVPLPAPPAPPAPPAISPGPAASKPTMATMMLFSTDDYPLAAISRNEEGAVRVEVVITPAGRVGDCRILDSSNSPALDVTTCAILQRRARYSPARDNLGRPVEDRQTVRIRWHLEDAADPAPFNSWTYRTIARLDGLHRPVGCRYEYGARGVELANCDAIFGMAKDVLANRRDLPAGKPVSLIFEDRVEANPAMTTIPTAATGRVLISSDSAEFEVSSEGELVKCRSIVREGRPLRDLCKTPFNKKFAKSPGDKRMARMSAAIYMEAAP